MRTAKAMALLLTTINPAMASDPGANYLTKLFINVCVPNLGQPAKVRQWADEHHLAQIQNQVALGVFVGAGDKGAAWAIPSAVGSFALSIRGTTEACAVWARTADPNEVQTFFKNIIEGVRRPGINVAVDKDSVTQGESGEAHALVYNVTAPDAPTSFEFTMLTAERPGGAFQASMQAARAGAHSN
jgi:hypothetical protein